MTSSTAPRFRNGTRSKRFRAARSEDEDQSRPPLRPLRLVRPLHLFLLSLLARLARFLLPASAVSSWRSYRRWRSTRLRGRAFGAALPVDDDDGDDKDTDEQVLRRKNPPPALAQLRLANCRDLASACELVAPGRLFRSSSPFAVSGGEGEEEESVEAAVEAAARALSGASASASASSSSSSSSSTCLNLALVIDLRSPNEWEAGRGDDVLRALEEIHSKMKQNEKKKKKKNETPPPLPPPLRVERVALQEWKRYTHAFVARLPTTRCLGAAAHFLLLKALGFRPPIPGMHARLCADTERGGLLSMNTTVLAAFPREIARVLRLISEAASPSSPSSSSSVMIACKLGKDRTGIVSALCLVVAGASRAEVVSDYARSGAELRGRPPPATAPSLGGAPRSAMERTLDWLSEHFAAFADEKEVETYRSRERRRRRGGFEGNGGGLSSSSRPRPHEDSPCWRAGVLGYLERECRFLAEEREALRRALTE